jgi:erythromycin esterase-like protein
MKDEQIIESLSRCAQRLDGSESELDGLATLASRARFVLIGEASHGTHEFYRDRARITQKLIADHGFMAVAIEGDWPDALRVEQYVRGRSDDGDAEEALQDFERFPTWMWRNRDVLAFVDWLRDHNDENDLDVGFYGLDLYSLHRSMSSVVQFLETVDPEAATEARARYACFDHAGGDPQLYGLAASRRLRDCEDDVVRQLVDLRRRRLDVQHGDATLADQAFFAEQNALVVKNGETYYRQLFEQRANTWNIRDRHMVETLEALAAHLERRNEQPAKVVVWAHNSHLGDALATEMALRDEVDVGQLCRARWGKEVFLLGQTTYRGSVTCASDWDRPAERKRVNPGRPDSWEGLLYEVPHPRFWIDCHHPNAVEALAEHRLERMIGVIYRPETERQSHYVDARLGLQFDAVLHSDTTVGVQPLEAVGATEEGELPETFPSAM